MRKAISMLCISALFLLLMAPSTPGASAQSPGNLTAQAAIVIDYETGEILFEKDAHTPRVPASMTKVMTAFIVYQEIEKGNLTMDTLIQVSPYASRIAGDTNFPGAAVAIQSGAEHSVDTLLHLAMLPSSNGACIVFAEHLAGSEDAFAVIMNETAASLGMYSDFKNSHGSLPHYTDAYSIGILVREFIARYPDILRITSTRSMNFRGIERRNTNRFLHTDQDFYEGADGFKTGTIDAAGFCLASTAVRDGRRVIAVVMNTQNNTGRYGDSAKLLDFGFAEIARRSAADAASTSLNVVVDGQPVTFDVPPRLINDRVMAPAAFVQALGGRVQSNQPAGSVTLSSDDGDTVTFTSRSSTMVVNGASVDIDVRAQFVSDTVFIPIRFLSEAMGKSVSWDGQTRTVTIETKTS